jgi:hypothetical protein
MLHILLERMIIMEDLMIEFEGYYLSPLGLVFDIEKKNTIPQYLKNDEFYVKLNDKEYKVDELIAKNLVSNPENLPLLIHKNGNILDNRIANLQWVNKNYQTEQIKKEGDFESPAYHVLKVPINKIISNTYNPNAVGGPETQLLYTSILEDGYTMPIVCYYNKDDDIYVIVDGFHRYQTMMNHKDIMKREGGYLPVTIIDKPLTDRMASTIRHNRARGQHDVTLMSNIVATIHKLGRSDAWIAKHIGMDKDEILRLKQFSGLAELFKNQDFDECDSAMHKIVMKNGRAHVVKDE